MGTDLKAIGAYLAGKLDEIEIPNFLELPAPADEFVEFGPADLAHVDWLISQNGTN